MPDRNRNILVLCTHNAVRSPMAEAMIKVALGERTHVRSGGVVADDRPNAFAIKAMKEFGLPIGAHRPRTFHPVAEEHFDLVIALSETALPLAREVAGDCGASVEYWETAEPPGVMAGLSQTQMIEAYRRLRDEIRSHVENRFDVKVRAKSGLQ